MYVSANVNEIVRRDIFFYFTDTKEFGYFFLNSTHLSLKSEIIQNKST